MASGSADNIKQWKFPEGNFIQNLSGHNSILNCMAINSDGVLVSGGFYIMFFFKQIEEQPFKLINFIYYSEKLVGILHKKSLITFVKYVGKL